MPALSPIESEFASTEEAEAYDIWFRAKVRWLTRGRTSRMTKLLRV